MGIKCSVGRPHLLFVLSLVVFFRDNRSHHLRHHAAKENRSGPKDMALADVYIDSFLRGLAFEMKQRARQDE